MIDKPEKFWERLGGWIKLQGLSMRKFSIEAGINYDTLKRSELRNSIPGPEILVKIAEYTGRSIEYFVTGKDPWTGKEVDSETAKLMEDLAGAPDATRRIIKAMLEEDRKHLEEKKRREQAGDTGDMGPGPGKRGRKKAG